MVTTENRVDWGRLKRFVSGECSPAEAREVEAWLAADPKHADLLMKFGMAGQGKEARQRHSTMRHFARLAAIVVVIGGGALFWRAARSASGLSSAARHFSTGPGERLSIALSDSTRVVLSAASDLRVHRGYGLTERNVTLVGEALFTVHHDAEKPFHVNIGGRVIDDLGSEFSARAYAAGDTLFVVVTSGSVTLRHADADDSLVVTAGHTGLLPAEGAGVVSVTP